MSETLDWEDASRSETRTWTGRAVLAQARASRLTAAVVVGLALAGCWALTYAAGGAGRVPPHAFYLPILLAAARFGVVGAALTALAAGLVAGPLLPLDVSAGTAQHASDWITRLGFFLLIGVVMGSIVFHLRSALEREVSVATKERDLAQHKAAVIATVSHEFRTPLTVIRGVARTLGRQDVDQEAAGPLVTGLRDAGEKLDSLVRTLLAVAEGLEGGTHLRPEPVAVDRLCSSVGEGLARLGGPSRVRVAASGEGSRITTDPAILTQVLTQIVGNALKFSPPEAPVDVEIVGRRAGVEVRVRDRGPGMTPEFLARAFEPFTQEDQSSTRLRDGVGIGLFAAQRLLEVLGGRIDIGSAPGRGTIVSMWVPDLAVANDRPASTGKAS